MNSTGIWKTQPFVNFSTSPCTVEVKMKPNLSLSLFHELFEESRFYKKKLMLNESRICGKGVGLDLFPSDSFESESNTFDEIAHIGP